MTFEQAFLKIKAKFDKADITGLTNEFAIQVNMTDEDAGGAFYIQFTDGKLFVEPYDYRDNTADVTLTRENLNKILDKKLSVATALESGRLYINGNAEDFVAVVSVVKAPEKKTVKKAAVSKKATEKKTAEKKVAAKPAAKKAPAKTTEKAPAKTAEKAPAEKKTAKKTTK